MTSIDVDQRANFEIIQNFVHLGLQEALEAERMLNGLSCRRKKFHPSLRYDIARGLNTIRQALSFKFCIAVQRLLQGEDRGTIRGLLKAGRPLLTKDDFETLTQKMVEILSSDNANYSNDAGMNSWFIRKSMLISTRDI